MSVKLIFVILFTVLLYSCGTMMPSIPPVPLKEGEGEARIGMAMSLGQFPSISLQANFHWGISSNDILGVSFNNAPVPSHLAYAHYWNINKNYGGNFQFHVGNLIFNEFNPDIESDVAFSNFFSEGSQSIKIGFGLYSSILRLLFGKNTGTISLKPVFGYLLQYNSFQIESQLNSGLTEYYIDYYNEGHWGSIENQSEIINHNNHVNEITDSIDWRKGKVKKILLKDSTFIQIAENDPFADCIYCGMAKIQKSKYLADSLHQVLWVTDNRLKNSLQLMEINLDKILIDYGNGKDLIIKEDEDLVNKKKSKVNPLWDNISFGIGYRYRK